MISGSNYGEQSGYEGNAESQTGTRQSESQIGGNRDVVSGKGTEGVEKEQISP